MMRTLTGSTLGLAVVALVALSSACSRDAESAPEADELAFVAEVPPSEDGPSVEQGPTDQDPPASGRGQPGSAGASGGSPAADDGPAGRVHEEEPEEDRSDPRQEQEVDEPEVNEGDLDVPHRTDEDDPGIERPAVDRDDAEDLDAPRVRAGTRITVTSDIEITTEDHVAGDPVIATVAEDLLAPDGMVLIPQGAKLLGRVVSAESSSGPDVDPILEIEFETLSTEEYERPIQAVVVEADLESSRKDSDARTAAKIGGAAAAGAILGKILGKDTEDAVKGGVAGAVAGTVIAMEMRPGEAKLKVGAIIVVELQQALILD